MQQKPKMLAILQVKAQDCLQKSHSSCLTLVSFQCKDVSDAYFPVRVEM